MIYFDNAATTMRKPDCVIDAVSDAMRNFGNSGRGAHEASLDASRMIYETRERISELFNLGNPLQVAFTSNSTESLNTAIQGLFSKGDHVITTVLEHNSVLRPLYLMENRGVSLTILPCDEKGVLCYDQLEESIRPETKAVVYPCLQPDRQPDGFGACWRTLPQTRNPAGGRRLPDSGSPSH